MPPQMYGGGLKEGVYIENSHYLYFIVYFLNFIFMVDEVWMPIVKPFDTNGKYEISSYGRLKRVGYYAKIGKHYKPDLIRILSSSGKYKKVALLIDGVLRNISIHRLVCFTFIPNPENRPHVNHINGIKHDNRLANLEWCTQSENMRHAQSIGLVEYAKPKVKLNLPRKKRVVVKTKEVVNIETGERYSSANELCQLTGITLSALRKKLNGDNYNQTPYRYAGQEYLSKQRPVRKIRIAVFDMEWNLIGHFDNHSDLAPLIGHKKSKEVSNFIRGKCSHYKGYKFKKINPDGSYQEPTPFVSKKPPVKPKKERQAVTPSKKIGKYGLDGILIEIFDSLGQAAKSSGAEKRNLKKQIRKSGKYKGFVYKFE